DRLSKCEISRGWLRFQVRRPHRAALGRLALWTCSSAHVGCCARRATDLLHLGLHSLELLLKKRLLQSGHLLRILGAHKLLGKIEGGIDVGLSRSQHIPVHITCSCLRRLHGGLDLLLKVRGLLQVLVYRLLSLGEGGLSRLS